jgi:cyclic pyranopterin monophosphate synthase
LLTIYDMAKAVDKSMVISDISLAQKVGGGGGEYARLDGTAVAP